MTDNTQDFVIPHTKSVTFFCDNRSAFHIVTNTFFHECTKHIEIGCHVVYEKVETMIIHLMPIDSPNQMTNIFTKPLYLSLFSNLHKLELIDIYFS